MTKNSKIYVAGHRGLVGSAVCRVLKHDGFTNVITATRDELDLRVRSQVFEWFSEQQPEYVFLCAAKVGGIMANSTQPVDFMLENLAIQNNVMEAAAKFEADKLLFLGSACSYPRLAKNPIHESDLLTGALEPSNECYALAKICGVKLCQAFRKQYGCNFIACQPTNLYGIGDHYDLNNSHVLPGMLMRMYKAKCQGESTVKLWGSGNPTREFLYSDDLAWALLLLMEKYNGADLVNVGGEYPVPLWHAADEVAKVVGFTGAIFWDHTHPDGTPNRQLNSSRIFGMGWTPKVALSDGLRRTYQDFLRRYEKM